MTQPLPYHHLPPGGHDADLSHLKTLAICHYVWGGLTILLSSVFIFHIVMGVVMLSGGMPFPTPPTTGPAIQPPPDFFGWFFIGIGSFFILLGWTTGILTILSGRRLAQRRSRTFSLVVAGLNCLSVPVGTTLGVFTFIVLFRPSVQALYDQERGTPNQPPP
jgi:hypothetical protein